MARFHDCVSAMDKEGLILKQLKKTDLRRIPSFSSPIMDQVCLGTSELYSIPICPPIDSLSENGKDWHPQSLAKISVAWLPLLILLPRYSVLPVSQSPSMRGKSLWLQSKNGNGISSLDIGIGGRGSRFARSTRDQRYLYIRNYMPWATTSQPPAGYQ